MIGCISSWDVWGEDFVLSEQPIDGILAEAWSKVGYGGRGQIDFVILGNKDFVNVRSQGCGIDVLGALF